MVKVTKTSPVATHDVEVETVSNGETSTMAISPEFEMTFRGFTVTLGQIPPTSIAYLLRYGFNQTLQDLSMAGVRDQLERKNPQAHFSNDDVAAALASRRTARVEALLNGTIGVRVAGEAKTSGTSFDKMVLTIAKEAIAALAKAKGKAVPKKEALAAIISAYVAKHGDTLKAEAQRRIDAANAASGEIDLDDLLED